LEIGSTSSSLVVIGTKEQRSSWSNVEQDDVSPQIVSAMEELYPKTMKKIWDYISADEIRIIKKKADELKAKKM